MNLIKWPVGLYYYNPVWQICMNYNTAYHNKRHAYTVPLLFNGLVLLVLLYNMLVFYLKHLKLNFWCDYPPFCRQNV